MDGGLRVNYNVVGITVGSGSIDGHVRQTGQKLHGHGHIR